jgi:hypothetical protein
VSGHPNQGSCPKNQRISLKIVKIHPNRPPPACAGQCAEVLSARVKGRT